MPEQENPYRSPDFSGQQREKCESQFRTTQSDEGPDGDLFHYYGLGYYCVRLVGPLILLYGVLAIEYPLLWAYGTAIILMFGFGLLTTKLVFNFQRPLYVWGLAPIFGACWIFFFWIIYMLWG
jgi:hypothetical protein